MKSKSSFIYLLGAMFIVPLTIVVVVREIRRKLLSSDWRDIRCKDCAHWSAETSRCAILMKCTKESHTCYSGTKKGM
jgi:hypothetical protein